ncbi:MAG: aldehyde ferredoxin oxidoreductase N-terminal domain-containing protein [Methylocystaceae bacterium]
MLGTKAIRVLKVDLTTGRFLIEDRTDLFRFLGGAGVAINLLAENMNEDLDPLDEKQPLVFAAGPMTAIYPAVTKTCLMFRSPLTGELGESYAGGRAALAIRYAGFDALVITGRAPRPVYLTITHNRIQIKPAEPLWGTSVEESGRYVRESEAGRGFRSIIRIGQGGERQVRFASLNVDTFRHFGRLGAGTVFGAKNLKAIYIYGDNNYPIPSDHFKDYRELYRELYDRVLNTDAMEKYHDLGTPVNIMVLNEMGALPTCNLQQNRHDQARELSGEEFAEHSLVRQVACVGCPIGCIHLAMLRKRFGGLHEWESTVLPYDHELIFALGTFLGLTNREDFLDLLDAVENFGLDAMTTGVLLGWATEALQKGVISEEQLGCSLKFGEVTGYKKVVAGIVKQETEFYQDLARGTEYAAARYGGSDYALCLGGNEMTGYHTGYGAMIGQAVSARHSHLDNAGYSLDQKADKQYTPETMARALYDEEKIRGVLNSLVICLFARKIYDLDTTARCLNVLGYEHTAPSLTELGEEIYYTKMEVKKRLGFDFGKLRLPRRFFETPTPHGQLQEEVAVETINCFNQLVMAGWPGQNRQSE